MTQHLKILQDMEDALDDAYAAGIRNAKREWFGLTEAQRVEIAGGELTRDERMIAIAIEAELKKLNT